jgi:hypothetical protein
MVVVGALEVVRDTMSIHLKVATRSALSVEEGNKIGKATCHSISLLKTSDMSSTKTLKIRVF